MERGTDDSDSDDKEAAPSREVEPLRGEAHPSALPATDDVLRKFAALGAEQAFRLDTAALSQFKVPDSLLRSLSFPSTIPQSLLDQIAASIPEPRLPPDLVAQLGTAHLPPSFWESVASTIRYLGESTSVAALYGRTQSRAVGRRSASTPRKTRTAESFFNEHAVAIGSAKELLRAFATVQSKNRAHRLVWRGQQDARWSVHSSLYRRLSEDGPVNEDRLVETEIATFAAAETWGRSSHPPLHFLATLQHHGAPTRLLDATTDPEVAAWFAVEADPTLDDFDGLVIGWGRAPRTKAGITEVSETLPQDTEVPFWHAWTNEEARRRVSWGTGTRTWAWFPSALNDRMRAQRAGFVLEAGPILSEDVVSVFTKTMPTDWRATEIARATSVIGLPSPHAVKSKPNDANLVPLFTFRVAADAKREIRDYLESKGLSPSTMYPDLGGLVRHLSGPFGPR